MLGWCPCVICMQFNCPRVGPGHEWVCIIGVSEPFPLSWHPHVACWWDIASHICDYSAFLAFICFQCLHVVLTCKKVCLLTFPFYVSKALTMHSTQTPSITHNHDRNGSMTALTPPHTSSAKSLKWDSRSHKRTKVLSTTKDGVEVQAVLGSLLDSAGGAGGNEEKRASPSTLIYTQRNSPPSACTAQYRMCTRSTKSKGSWCVRNARTLPMTPFTGWSLNSKQLEEFCLFAVSCKPQTPPWRLNHPFGFHALVKESQQFRKDESGSKAANRWCGVEIHQAGNHGISDPSYPPVFSNHLSRDHLEWDLSLTNPILPRHCWY